MRTTLFHIPHDVVGWPLLGVGLALAVWVAICAVRLAWRLFRRGSVAEVWNEVPVMFVIGAIVAIVLPAISDSQGLPIRGYGVMLFLGVISGVALAAYRAKREGFDPELIYSLAFWMCLCGILGARLFYVIEYWRDFQRTGLAKPSRPSSISRAADWWFMERSSVAPPRRFGSLCATNCRCWPWPT